MSRASSFVVTASLGSKVFSNPCCNLAIGHLVSWFNTDDASTQSFIRETFLKLLLRLARTEEQDGFRVMNMRDHLVIVSVEVGRKLSVSLVVCRAFL